MNHPNLQRGIAWSILALAAVLAAVWGDAGTRVVALALLGTAAWRAAETGRPYLSEHLPAWSREALGPLLIVAMVTALYGRLLLGDMPVNHDHPVLLLRAWITGSQLIPAGQISGFSLTQFAGYPANALYPIGTDLLVCAIRGLGLGLVSWETAYCWALFLAVTAYPTALYAIGRRMGGPLAGLIAGGLGLIDRGAWFQAGWDFNLNWGVWSMGLSFSLCLWALWAFERLARYPGRRGLWLGAAAAAAGAVLSHPMAVALLGVCLPLMLVVMIARGQLPAPGSWLPSMISAGLMAAGLCAFWLIPFVARQAWFEPLASPYRPYSDVLHGLLDGNLLGAVAPVLAITGLIGLGLGARQARPLALFWLLACGLLLFVSTDSFLLGFDVLAKLPSVAQLQLERLTYPVRAGLLLGVGLLAVGLLRPAAEAAGPALGVGPGRHAIRLLLGLVLAPLVVYAGQLGPLPWFAPTPALQWSSQSDLYRDLRAAADYLNAQPRAGLGRIALIGETHAHLLLSLPVYTSLPVFKVGFTPENNYRYKFSSERDEVFQALGVSHALAIGPHPGADREEIARFGQLVLYRLRNRPSADYRLQGPGRAVLEHQDREALDFQLSGTGPESRLVIYRGRYELWHAEQNGTPVPIEGAQVADSPAVFMSLPVRDGPLRLRYRNGLAERLGDLLTWFCLAVFGLLGLPARLAHPRRWLQAKLARWTAWARDGLALAGLAGGAAIGLWLLIKLLLPASSPYPGREVIDNLADRLPAAKAEVIRQGLATACAPWDGTRHKCPGPEWNYVGEVIASVDHQLRKCIWLHPIQGARHSITFEDVDLGEFIQGFFALDDRVVEPPRPQPVDLIVLLDGAPVGRFRCEARRGWFEWEVATSGRSGTRGRITLQSEATFTGRRHFCVTASTTRPQEWGSR